MIITLKQPTFEYFLEDPTIIRYEPEVKGEWIVEEIKPKWKSIIVQTYSQGVPTPKEDQILYKYTENRGYLLTI